MSSKEIPATGRLDTQTTQVFDGYDEPVCICGPGGGELVIEYGNPRFDEVFGAAATLADLLGAAAPGAAPRLKAIAANGGSLRLDLAPGLSGQSFSVFAAQMAGSERLLLIFKDTSSESSREAQLIEDARMARAQLAELNHRLLNSLSIIEGLAAPDGTEAGIAERLQAMHGLYAMMVLSEGGDRVQSDRYLPAIVDKVRGSIGREREIEVFHDIAPLDLGAEAALSLGIVVNEAMTNAYKHAFPGGRRGRIAVEFRPDGQGYLLKLADDGTGMGDGTTGLGRKMIAAFAGRLDARVSVETGPRGTTIMLYFRTQEV